jgi:hypothetical protein
MAGVQHFLKKPVSLDCLHETVARLVSKKDAGVNGVCP